MSYELPEHTFPPIRTPLIPEELVEMFERKEIYNNVLNTFYSRNDVLVYYKDITGPMAIVDAIIISENLNLEHQQIVLKHNRFSGGHRGISWHEIDWNGFWITDLRFGFPLK